MIAVLLGEFADAAAQADDPRAGDGARQEGEGEREDEDGPYDDSGRDGWAGGEGEGAGAGGAGGEQDPLARMAAFLVQVPQRYP